MAIRTSPNPSINHTMSCLCVQGALRLEPQRMQQQLGVAAMAAQQACRSGSGQGAAQSWVSGLFLGSITKDWRGQHVRKAET